uniref:Toxin-antitoxin system YwqK family antitoxin n=1 Tax=Tenacibaculum sp. Pbs-1 TaxID=3238748 RepID=A0AB33KXH5_9FLAO
MKFKLTIIILLFSTIKTYSCSCEPKPDFKSQNDLNEYDFIAHVKITDIKNTENKKPEFLVHSTSFNIIELYKGKELKNILVTGSNELLKGWTSCDLGERIGDEWMIFGYTNKKTKKLQTGYCTRSTRIKSYDGYENLSFPSKTTLKKRLQILFDKEIIEESYNGKRIEFYENGNKQLEEFYKRQKLNGERKLWYPNGKLQSLQNYKKGYKNGVFKWYSKQGNLIKFEKFRKSINIDTTNIWRSSPVSHLSVSVYSDLNNVTKKEAFEILSKRHVWQQYIFDKKGNTLYSVWYLPNGNKWQEFIFDKKSKQKINKYYDSKGKLKSELITTKGKRVSEKEWNDLGELIKHKMYDKKGKIIKENIYKKRP